ncbi:MAG: SDR family oxidoreductase [Tepidisphaeraceae bacterium]|jgi:NAD(P)-dependent dehydrogenase (short-subunit alcohol dehydrogenase family)
MSDRVAIVTGAGRGIGRAVAVELARRGYRLALVSRTQRELEETRALCGGAAKTSSSSFSFVCDVADAQRVDALVEDVLANLGRVDVLAHCAGMAVMKSIEQLSIEQWRGMLDTNLSSVYFLCRRLWSVFRRQGGGVVVNVSSYAARDPFAGLGAYGAAKAGVNLLGLALAREGAEIGVRVHTVAPAATETAMLRSLLSADQLPADKTLEPEAVARVIVQCICGDLACSSGEVIYVHK